MARSRRLRTTRRPLDMAGAVIAGSPRHRPIVYGYRFPSRPQALKVGYSSRGVERIREQTTGFPEPPQVVFVIHDKNAAAVEKRIHHSLASAQIHDTVGVEWFHASLEDVVKVSPELRRALGRQRWRALWRWMMVLLACMVGFLAAPVVAAFLGRPGSLQVDVDAYVAALMAGTPQAWSLAAQEGWKLLVGPVGLETRLLAAVPVVLMAWFVFGRSR